MAGTFTDFWRIVQPAPQKSNYITANTETAKLYSNFSWYTKIMKGASSRFQKYNQYKNMDNDVFVARALDTIAEEMTSINARNNLPFEIDYQTESNAEIPETITLTIRAALRHWCDIQDFNKCIFDIARATIKYGDCFFRKTSDFKKWQFLEAGDIIGVSIDDYGNPMYYHVRTGEKNKQGAFGDVLTLPAAAIIQFSLTSQMTEDGPYGQSVLFPCIKAFRHLSLLEDSVIIYRIVRAPERRVFIIDTGNMPAQKQQAYLQAIRTEMKQKRIPNETGGQDAVDSVYNPVSMTEDIFLAQSADGRGTKVDTLPGGESLGEIRDLYFFQNKLLQGLRIPSSYMRGGADGGVTVADGKVGVAYIEELRFANYVNRLQQKLNDTFDNEFKCYLKSANLKIDTHLFKIKLMDPQNFIKYKQAEVDEKMISNYSSIKDDDSLSVRFKQMHYLGLLEDEIQENETLLRQERGIPENGIDETLTDIRMMYDKEWAETKPKIKVDEDYDDHSKKKEEPPEPVKDEETSIDDNSEESNSKESNSKESNISTDTEESTTPDETETNNEQGEETK